MMRKQININGLIQIQFCIEFQDLRIRDRIIFKRMASNEEQVRKLHEKLNVLESVNPENNQKIKLTHVQEIVNKVVQESYQEEESGAAKIREYVEVIRKIEARMREQAEQTEKLEQQSKIKIARAKKISERAIEKMTKERKDTGKKINVALEGFLVELMSAKAKSNSSCKFAIKEFSNLELQLANLESQIAAEENATKDITKKIYAQFSTQIEELSELLTEQKKQKEAQEQKIMTLLQRVSTKIQQRIKESSKQRESNEQQIVNFLEKIIQKIRHEIMSK